MPFQEMKIQGAWLHTPVRHADQRGFFEEKFRISEIKSGLLDGFEVEQINLSVSNRGVIRGIHYSVAPSSQAKYISCPKGAIWDVVVDVRPDSPTFGQWDAVELSAINGNSVLISEGIGHAFMSLINGSTVVYSCSAEYVEDCDRTIHPFDTRFEIDFQGIAQQHRIENFIISEKDSAAKDYSPK